jgi:hypothetical protein
MPSSPINALARRDGWKCHYCGIEVESPKHMSAYPGGLRVASVDHIIPVYLKGPSELWNLVIACLDCNRKKSNRTYEDFMRCDWLPLMCAQAGYPTTQAFVRVHAPHLFGVKFWGDGMVS